MFNAKKLPLTDGGYVQVMLLPTLVMCAAILILNQLMMKPEKADSTSRCDFATGRLKALGSVKSAEMITALVVFSSIAGVDHICRRWSAADRIQTAPPSDLCGGNVREWQCSLLRASLRTRISGQGSFLTLLLFLGGIFSLTHIIPQYKITDWLAGIMAPRILPLASTPTLLLLVMAMLMLVMRFIDPSAFFAIPLLWTPLVDQLSSSGIPPLVLAATLLLM